MVVFHSIICDSKLNPTNTPTKLNTAINNTVEKSMQSTQSCLYLLTWAVSKLYMLLSNCSLGVKLWL